MRYSRKYKYVMRVWLCIMALWVYVFPLHAADPNKVDKSRFSYAASHLTDATDKGFMDRHKYSYETKEHLLVATRSDKSFIRCVSLRMLVKQIGEQAKPVLLAALDDPEVTVRRKAAELLAYLGDASGIPRMQKDFDEWVQRYEKGICDGNTAPRDPRVAWRVNSTPDEALAIGQILARFGDNRGFEFAAKVALENPLSIWRDRAVGVLVEIAQNDRSILMAENREPDPVFLVITQTDTDKFVLQRIVTAVDSMPGIRAETNKKILDTVIASQRAPEEIRMQARQAIERKEQAQRRLERQKRLKEQAKPAAAPEKPQK